MREVEYKSLGYIGLNSVVVPEEGEKIIHKSGIEKRYYYANPLHNLREKFARERGREGGILEGMKRGKNITTEEVWEGCREKRRG